MTAHTLLLLGFAVAPSPSDSIPPVPWLGVIDTVTVTADRGAGGIAVPGGVAVIRASTLLGRADPTIDDALRGTPGFGLFRRASSTASNPTTHGVSLRGLSSSGGSRALVLADGVPLNDPFGSWVAWDRVPYAAIDRIEIVRGSPSDLYGPVAVGGVIQVLTFTPGWDRLRVIADAASREGRRASLYASGASGPWHGAVAGEWQRSAGFVTTAPENRGAVDVPARFASSSGFAELGARLGAGAARLRVTLLDEDRGNGTVAQVNDTRFRQVETGVDGNASGGHWIAGGVVGDETYRQTFSAVAAGRDSERVTNLQHIGTRFAQGWGHWSRDWGRIGGIVGIDGRGGRATIDETRDPTGSPVSVRTLGRENAGGLYGRAHWRQGPRAQVTVGVRADAWRSVADSGDLPRHSATMVSSRVAASLKLGTTALVAAAYRAYRTPTLNELYRGFRAGNVVTLPNPALDPEQLTGVEVGILLPPAAGHLKLTVFHNLLHDAISNVTLSTSATQITRRRENSDRLRAFGVEAESEFDPLRRLRIVTFATWTRSRFDRTPAQPSLEGRTVPQVPAWQAGATVAWADRRLSARFEARATGEQFDDDLNQYRLTPYIVLDAGASRELWRQISLFIAGQNLLDAEYDVGRTPFRTIGTPRTVRVGVSFLSERRP